MAEAREARKEVDAMQLEHGSAPPGGDGLKERGGVQSIERAFAILEEVALHREGIRLGDLSRSVGLHNSTTFHLVKTMVLLGYLRQMPGTKCYRIGRPLFTLAASALDETEMVTLATPVLESLSKATEESCHFAVRSGDDVVVLARTAGTGAFQLAERAGVVRPAHCTALGKVLLASLSPDQLEDFLKRRALTSFTPKTITDPELLRREVEEARRNGIAYDDGEFNSEVRCVAVAVRNFSGQVVGAVGVSGPVWRLSLAALQDKARLVRERAVKLSSEFGYTDLSAPKRTFRD
ncbi:MAG: IclR family transcriptional regulator [Hyphomicrobiaceae bacterium]|nr:IclR family transcriptional regulator [Hyphomicrobiaceae bacterium]